MVIAEDGINNSVNEATQNLINQLVSPTNYDALMIAINDFNNSGARDTNSFYYTDLVLRNIQTNSGAFVAQLTTQVGYAAGSSYAINSSITQLIDLLSQDHQYYFSEDGSPSGSDAYSIKVTVPAVLQSSRFSIFSRTSSSMKLSNVLTPSSTQATFSDRSDAVDKGTVEIKIMPYVLFSSSKAIQNATSAVIENVGKFFVSR